MLLFWTSTRRKGDFRAVSLSGAERENRANRLDKCFKANLILGNVGDVEILMYNFTSPQIYFILFLFFRFFLQIDTVDFSWNSSNERKNILMRFIWTAMRIRRLKIPRTASVHIETRDNNNKYRPKKKKKKKKKERKKKSWKERNDDADIRDESWARKRPS